jgi:hypothetical protein
MGQNHDYMPKTYQPIVPPKPTLQVPPAFQSPPTITPPPQPSQAPAAPPAAQNSGGGTISGNGLPYCSGPNSPGYNVSTGKCMPISTTTNAIVPQQTVPSSLKLSQLPYTNGDDPVDGALSAAFYLLVIGLALSAMPFVLKRIRYS